MASLIDPLLLKAVMPQATARNMTRFAPALARTLEHYSITGTLRTAHFLAQVAHESGQLAFTAELASGTAYEGRVDLGNVQPGDGARFKGRGLIQITGRSNYQAYSHACRQDLLSGDNPSRLATDTALAADVAGWFWQAHGLNALADNDDVIRITRRINGGLNGLAERQTFLALAKTALERAAETTTGHAMTRSPAPTTTPTVMPDLSAAAAIDQAPGQQACTSIRLPALPAADRARNWKEPRTRANTQYRNAA